tara:strand:- start:202 stop:321 length:120 start_codon:yes stop_codon:yes gene_type:complete
VVQPLVAILSDMILTATAIMRPLDFRRAGQRRLDGLGVV